LLKKFDADTVLKLCEVHKTTLFFGVPTTMNMLSLSDNFLKYDLSSIRYAIVGGEPLSIEVIRKWNDRNIPIRQGYGLTEFGPNVFSLNELDSIRKMGSVGFLNQNIEAKIVLENGDLATAQQIGELWLKGPACMKGYWENSKATAEALEEGWLKTGDYFYFDQEGYYYVVGRKKEMFKSGGENVYPAEIEKVLMKLNWISEVAVVGIPHAKWGEVGHAFVVCEASKFDSQKLKDHCAKNLAKFKIPQFFSRLNELPKSGAGKILKKELLRVSLRQ
jgi:fatty-acyl-CoA synthase